MAVTLQRLDLRHIAGDLKPHLPRPALDGDGPVAAVRDILSQVKEGGDAAVRALTLAYDGVAIDSLRVPQAALDAALASVPAPLRDALEAARSAISSFQRSTLPPSRTYEREGLVVRDLRRPVDRAGVYVPGGRAP